MKFPFFIFTISILFSCKYDPLAKYKVPDSILKANLVEKYNRAKWEVYKENRNIFIEVQGISQKVNFLQCDLGEFFNERDSHTTFLSNDTVMTIYLFPSFNKTERTNFTNLPDVVFGASFKGDSLKYMPNGDKSFMEVNDSISKSYDTIFVKHIEGHRNDIHPWIVDYALSKRYIK